MYHEVRGDGGDGHAPLLVFVHGFSCDHGDWEPLVTHFEGRYRCVSVDLPGHGRSPAGDRPPAIDRFIDEVTSLVSPMSAATPVVLFGHSMGCRVAISVANRLGDRAAGVVPIDGSCFAVGNPRAVRAATLAKVADAGFAAVAEGMFAQMFTPGSPKAFADAVMARALRMDPRDGGALLADMAAWDAAHSAAMLDAVRVPLMAIQSTAVDAERRRTVLAPGDGSPWTDSVAARVPGARIELIPGVGHFTMNEAPRRVNALVEDFLAGLGRRGADVS